MFLVISCSPSKQVSNEVNLYSQRHYGVDELQYKNFTELTGIKVNVVKANADELIERLKNEGENSRKNIKLYDSCNLFCRLLLCNRGILKK